MSCSGPGEHHGLPLWGGFPKARCCPQAASGCALLQMQNTVVCLQEAALLWWMTGRKPDTNGKRGSGRVHGRSFTSWSDAAGKPNCFRIYSRTPPLHSSVFNLPTSLLLFSISHLIFPLYPPYGSLLIAPAGWYDTVWRCLQENNLWVRYLGLSGSPTLLWTHTSRSQGQGQTCSTKTNKSGTFYINVYQQNTFSC